MDDKKKHCCCKKDLEKNARLYPGVAPNIADDCEVDPEMVKKEVRELNNNPRNTDENMP